MRVLLPALLLALALPRLAAAQVWDDLTSINLEGLDRNMARSGASYEKPSSDGSASLRVRDRKLIGVTLARNVNPIRVIRARSPMPSRAANCRAAGHAT